MAIPISIEDYLRNRMVKVNKHQIEDKWNKHIDRFAKNIILNTKWKWRGKIQRQG